MNVDYEKKNRKGKSILLFLFFSYPLTFSSFFLLFSSSGLSSSPQIIPCQWEELGH